jgi:hypothetical protein
VQTLQWQRFFIGKPKSNFEVQRWVWSMCWLIVQMIYKGEEELRKLSMEPVCFIAAMGVVYVQLAV